jgi:hypothetical protein
LPGEEKGISKAQWPDRRLGHHFLEAPSKREISVLLVGIIFTTCTLPLAPALHIMSSVIFISDKDVRTAEFDKNALKYTINSEEMT